MNLSDYCLTYVEESKVSYRKESETFGFGGDKCSLTTRTAGYETLLNKLSCFGTSHTVKGNKFHFCVATQVWDSPKVSQAHFCLL